MRLVVRVVHGQDAFSPARRAGVLLFFLFRVECRFDRGALGVVGFGRDLEIH